VSTDSTDSKGKVLIIDDDVDFLEISAATLASAGYSVTTAKSGEEGLAAAAEVTPDVVLLDLMLEKPDMGFTVAHQLRKQPELKEVTILLVTAAARETGFRFDLASPEDRRWIKVDRILNKPIARAELLARVAEAIGRVN
jgi:CheY-like chemotaxis protein